MNSLFSVSNVSVQIKGKMILSDLTFEVPERQIIGLLGPNGSGKTTTIKTCAGLLKKTSGKICCHGYCLDHDYEKFTRKISFVFDRPCFYPQLSGYENMMQTLRVTGVSGESSVDDYVSLVGLSQMIMKNVETYSLGMKQRLSLAIAMARKAKLLVLDEPFNGIDPEGIVDFRNLIVRMKKESNCSFILSSHMLKEIEQLADRVILIKQGKLVDDFLIEHDDVSLSDQAGRGIERIYLEKMGGNQIV